MFRALPLEPPNLDTDKFIDELLEVAEKLEKKKEESNEKKEDR